MFGENVRLEADPLMLFQIRCNFNSKTHSQNFTKLQIFQFLNSNKTVQAIRFLKACQPDELRSSAWRNKIYGNIAAVAGAIVLCYNDVECGKIHVTLNIKLARLFHVPGPGFFQIHDRIRICRHYEKGLLYLFLKTENSGRATESRTICVGQKFLTNLLT